MRAAGRTLNHSNFFLRVPARLHFGVSAVPHLRLRVLSQTVAPPFSTCPLLPLLFLTRLRLSVRLQAFSRDLLSSLGAALDFTASVRPFSPAVGAAARAARAAVARTPPSLGDEEAKSTVVATLERYARERLQAAHAGIASACLAVSAAAPGAASAAAGAGGAAGSELSLRPGDAVLTFGHSAAVEALLLAAHKQLLAASAAQRTAAAARAPETAADLHDASLSLPPLTVIIVDSRPLLGGQELLRRLCAAGIACVYAHLPSLPRLLRRERLRAVLLGAEAVGVDGAALAAAGSSLVARSAAAGGIPVLFAAEAVKFAGAGSGQSAAAGGSSSGGGGDRAFLDAGAGGAGANEMLPSALVASQARTSVLAQPSVLLAHGAAGSTTSGSSSASSGSPFESLPLGPLPVPGTFAGPLKEALAAAAAAAAAASSSAAGGAGSNAGAGAGAAVGGKSAKGGAAGAAKGGAGGGGKDDAKDIQPCASTGRRENDAVVPAAVAMAVPPPVTALAGAALASAAAPAAGGGGKPAAGGATPLHSWKFKPGLKLLAPAMDVTPASLIRALLTEAGPVPPAAAFIVAREFGRLDDDGDDGFGGDGDGDDAFWGSSAARGGAGDDDDDEDGGSEGAADGADGADGGDAEEDGEGDEDGEA